MCDSADEDQLIANRGASQPFLIQKEATSEMRKVDQITISYCGETQKFKTVWLAVYVLRHPEIKVGWFHTIKATVDLMVDEWVSQTRHFKGDKHFILMELRQLETDFKSLPG